MTVLWGQTKRERVQMDPNLKAIIDKHINKTYGSRYTPLAPRRGQLVGGPAPKEKPKQKATEKPGQKPEQEGHKDTQTSFQPPVTRDADGKLKGSLRELAKIAAAILAAEVGVKVEDIFSPKRDQKYACPRQAVMYFALRYTRYSQPQVGAAFRRDHTTAMHGRNRIAKVLDEGTSVDSPTIAEIETKTLVGLRKLCRRYSLELPASQHWPPEESATETSVPTAQITEQSAPAQTAAD